MKKSFGEVCICLSPCSRKTVISGAVGFEGEEIRFHASVQTEPRQTSDYYILMLTQLFTLYGVSGERITGVVLASVVPQLTPTLIDALARIAGRRHKLLSLSSGIKTGLNIRSDQPQQVGADRVAAAVAAKARGSLPCVVVDCGRATTFTVLDENGALVASAITAGVELSLEALRAQTAQLPTVALVRGAKYDVMARNTADAMRIGAVMGAAAMVDGLIGRYAAVLGKTPRVWLTGDCCQLIAPHLSIGWDRADDLILRGCGSFGAKPRLRCFSLLKFCPVLGERNAETGAGGIKMNNNKTNVRFLAQLGLLAAIEIVMKLIGLGSVPVGPLYMSFLTVPIAVGAMTMGPAAGAILGAVFGLVSFKDALSGLGMTGVFFQISPLNTFVLCVVMRVLMGFCVGLIFKALRFIDRRGGWSYFIGALSAPLLNTLFFMGYIVLVFYNTEFIQSKVADLGAVNPLMFVVLLVGVQGLIEAIVCCAAGGVITRAVSSFLSTRAPAKAAKTAKTED